MFKHKFIISNMSSSYDVWSCSGLKFSFSIIFLSSLIQYLISLKLWYNIDQQSLLVLNTKIYHFQYVIIIWFMIFLSMFKFHLLFMHLNIYHKLLLQTYNKSEIENNTLHLQTLSLFLIWKIIVMTHKFRFSINIKV